nr:cytochrome c oxidase subunit 3 [Pectinopygus varius]
MKKSYFHPFHIVELSPWPLVGSLAVGSMLVNLYSLLSGGTMIPAVVSLISTILVSVQWWRDVIRESAFQGNHTSYVCSGLYLGVSMFIVSEVFFFFSFFFGYFFIALNPDISLGDWPPVGVQPMSYMGVPVVNTVLLLSSGVSITWAHHSILESNQVNVKLGLSLTVLLGLVFLVFQGFEYFECSFSMADSVYGSLFFIATGFHGLHVMVGMIFILVCSVRVWKNHFSNKHHLGLEASIWYWHFVDVVWLFLFLTVYWWGS